MRLPNLSLPSLYRIKPRFQSHFSSPFSHSTTGNVVVFLFSHTKLQSQFHSFGTISSLARSAMEVPIINRISDFEAGISRLHNPSAVKAAGGFHTLWTWGAVILAVVAAFSSLIRRAKLLLLLRVPSPESLIPQSFIQSSVSSYDDDDDDDADDVSSSCSSSDGVDSDDDDEDVDFSTPAASGVASEMDFRVAGSGDGLLSKSVVKLWDGLGLDGLASSTMAWDLNLAEKVRSFSAGWSSHVLALCSPSTVVAAVAGEDHSRAALKVWDARVGSRSPAVVAEWSTPGSEIFGIRAGGVEKVYMSDVRQRLTVRDLRKVGTPLPEEAEEMDWHDAVAMFDANPPAAINGRGRGSGPVQRRRRQC